MEKSTLPSGSTSVALTLPLSCHICLSKVKDPAVCTNMHIFCYVCISLWLERTAHCPVCRTGISDSNPIRRVVGGESVSVKSSTAAQTIEDTLQMKRIRFKLLLNEYEKDIRDLNEQLNKQPETSEEGSVANKSIAAESGRTSAKNFEKIRVKLATTKCDLQKANEIIERLRDENQSLTAENSNLRTEVTNRSPRKFSRYTVAVLEGKVDQCEREIERLTKALSANDEYVDSLNRALARYKRAFGELAPQPQPRTRASISDIDMLLEDSRPDALKNDLFTGEEACANIAHECSVENLKTQQKTDEITKNGSVIANSAAESSGIVTVSCDMKPKPDRISDETRSGNKYSTPPASIRNMAGIGRAASGDVNSSMVIGRTADGEGSSSMVIGRAAGGEGNSAMVIGRAAGGEGNSAMVIGRAAGGEGNSAMVIGRAAGGEGNSAMVIGRAAGGEGNSSMVIGRTAGGEGKISMVIGRAVGGEGKSSMVIGRAAGGEGRSSMVIGRAASGEVNTSIVIGQPAGGRGSDVSPIVAKRKLNLDIEDMAPQVKRSQETL